MRILRSLAVLSLVLGLAVAGPALALADDPHGGSSGSVTNTNNNCTGGGACSPTATGGSATGGSASQSQSLTNTNTNTNVISNTQGQGQEQGQKQKQGQIQGQGQKQAIKDSANNSNNVDASTGDVPRQAPPAFAPGLVAAPETCMGAVAVGASSPFGGISFGTTYKSDDCELRMYARSLMALGPQYAGVALALLAQNPNVQKALTAAGMPISGVKAEVPLAIAPIANAAQLQAVAAVVSSPSRDEAKVLCTNAQRKIRAGNGEYFCTPQ